MATEDHDRPVPRILQRDSTPARPEGIGWGGIAFLAFIVAAVAFLGATLYSLRPPSTSSTPANDRQIVNPPNTTTSR